MRCRSIVALVLVAASLSLVGCAGDDNGDDAPTPSETQAATPDSSPADGAEDGAGDHDLAQVGEQVAQQSGCGTCHGAGIAPAFEGLAGSERTLDDGETVIADEAYLRESIVAPDAQVVEGYSADLMPEDFAERLSEEDIDAVIAYIQSLE